MPKTLKTALNEILKLAHKHEVQYWLDAPGTDAEKLAKIVTICRDALDPDPDAHAAAQEQAEADRLDAEESEKVEVDGSELVDCSNPDCFQLNEGRPEPVQVAPGFPCRRCKTVAEISDEETKQGDRS